MKLTALRRGVQLNAPTKPHYLVATLILLLLVLAACSQPGDPGAAMLKYLQARVAADSDAIRGLSCAAWEGQAVLQAELVPLDERHAG